MAEDIKNVNVEEEEEDIITLEFDDGVIWTLDGEEARVKNRVILSV